MCDRHQHPIGPRKPGRVVQDFLRCVCCGLSTRNKKFIACTASNAPGGRLCERCIKILPKDLEGAPCTTWIELLKSSDNCDSCCKQIKDLVSCYVCNRKLCLDCIVIETYNLFQHTGVDNMLCYSCCPNHIRTIPKGRKDYCYFCLAEHSSFGGTPPCLDPSVPVNPLVENLLEGTSIRVASSRSVSTAVSARPSVLSLDESLISARISQIQANQDRPDSRASAIVLPDTQRIDLSSEVLLTERTADLAISDNYITAPKSIELNRGYPSFCLNQTETHANAASSSSKKQPANTATHLSANLPPTCRAENVRTEKPVFGPNTCGLETFEIFDALLPRFDERLDFIVNKNMLALQQIVCKSASRVTQLEGKLEALGRSRASGAVADTPANDKSVQHCPKTCKEAKKLLEDNQPITLPIVKDLFNQGTRFLATEFSDTIANLSETLVNSNKNMNKHTPKNARPFSQNRGKKSQKSKFQKSDRS